MFTESRFCSWKDLMKRDIGKLVAEGFYKEAILTYKQLHSASFQPNKFTFPPLLKSCGKLKSFQQGRMLHTQLIKTGLNSHIYSSTALTGMYLQTLLVTDAFKVFDEIPDPSLVLMNSLMSGYSQIGFFKEAFGVFRNIMTGKFRPNSVTIASVLSASRGGGNGIQLHCCAVKLGVEIDVYVSTSLVSMYLDCGEVVAATKVFEKMLNKNVVSYNAFLSGVLQNGAFRVSLDVFVEMRQSFDKELPNSVTLVSVLSACANLGNVRNGMQVHGLVEKLRLNSDTMVATALVDMYSKCGCCQLADAVFKELGDSRNLITYNTMLAGFMLNGDSEKAMGLFEQLESEGFLPDSTTWNSMISGFSRLGKGMEALKFFNKMQISGMTPSLKSVTSLLGVFSDLSDTKRGEEIHAFTIRNETSTDKFMVSALIDMYMKCGYTLLAQRILDQFEVKPKDPAIWNALIIGYGRNGDDQNAFKIFELMKANKVFPNSSTFTSLLSVCSHTGNIDKGWEVFNMINKDYGLRPTAQCYGSMVDLLGRSGRLKEAQKLVQEMAQPSGSVFSSLLGACRFHLNTEIGVEMAKKLCEIEPDDSAPYVNLSNLYAAKGRWSDAEMVRVELDDNEVRKIPGYSLIGVT